MTLTMITMAVTFDQEFSKVINGRFLLGELEGRGIVTYTVEGG